MTAEAVQGTGRRLARPFQALGVALIADEAKRLGFLMSLPAQLLLLFIVVFPLLMQIYVSVTYWGPLDGESWIYAYKSLNWFENYGELFVDGRFWAAIGRTLLVVGVCVPIEFLLGLGLATLFADRFAGRRIFYSILLTPMMIVPAVAGYMFFMLFQSNGPINDLFSRITGLTVDFVWLSDNTLALVAVMIADIWQWTPLMFLILLAGMLGVPEDQIKAATLLGANSWQRFWRIVLPKMRTVMIIAIVIRAVECFKIFDLLAVMTKGGPGVETETLSYYIYKLTFADLEWAYVAALGLFILIALSVLAWVALWRMQKAQARATAPIGG
jgi:multiple sugar transport system permease protein